MKVLSRDLLNTNIYPAIINNNVVSFERGCLKKVLKPKECHRDFRLLQLFGNNINQDLHCC